MLKAKATHIKQQKLLKRLYSIAFSIGLCTSGLVILISCASWGFFAHKRINRTAVYTLPLPMRHFYLANIDYLTQHAIDADKKRYVDSFEAPRHFFDADRYGKHPFAKMPQRWAEAERQYSADSLNKYGILPWTIQRYYYKLVRAFKDHDTLDILKTSAYLGHYIADAHVPLHLTQNYNGQFTGQTGIHALWETRIVELFSNGYSYRSRPVHYINSPLKEAWKICNRTYRCVDSVLRFEQQLNIKFTPDSKYSMVKHGRREQKDYSEAYAAAYQKALHGMVARQMRLSITETSSFWYTAWVDAGQPNLYKLTDKTLWLSVKAQTQHEYTLYKQGKAIPIERAN